MDGGTLHHLDDVRYFGDQARKTGIAAAEIDDGAALVLHGPGQELLHPLGYRDGVVAGRLLDAGKIVSQFAVLRVYRGEDDVGLLFDRLFSDVTQEGRLAGVAGTNRHEDLGLSGQIDGGGEGGFGDCTSIEIPTDGDISADTVGVLVRLKDIDDKWFGTCGHRSPR